MRFVVAGCQLHAFPAAWGGWLWGRSCCSVYLLQEPVCFVLTQPNTNLPSLPHGCDHPAFIQGRHCIFLPSHPLCWGIQEDDEHPGTVRDTRISIITCSTFLSALWKVSWASQNQSLSQTATLLLPTAPRDLLTSRCLEAQCSVAYSWQSPSVSCAGIWLPACMTDFSAR